MPSNSACKEKQFGTFSKYSPVISLLGPYPENSKAYYKKILLFYITFIYIHLYVFKELFGPNYEQLSLIHIFIEI